MLEHFLIQSKLAKMEEKEKELEKEKPKAFDEQKMLLESIGELEKQLKQRKEGKESEYSNGNYGIVEKMEKLFAQMGGEMGKQQTMLCSKIEEALLKKWKNFLHKWVARWESNRQCFVLKLRR
ncbi:hypothetical protein niasHS_004747 [Heterodera schachtii]|uniref:Uncharacterized protein n=1 Tax=Heterodera schachtii TaxID=97005 RepID=A0ABD2JTH9_HETSC